MLFYVSSGLINFRQEAMEIRNRRLQQKEISLPSQSKMIRTMQQRRMELICVCARLGPAMINRRLLPIKYLPDGQENGMIL